MIAVMISRKILMRFSIDLGLTVVPENIYNLILHNKETSKMTSRSRSVKYLIQIRCIKNSFNKCISSNRILFVHTAQFALTLCHQMYTRREKKYLRSTRSLEIRLDLIIRQQEYQLQVLNSITRRILKVNNEIEMELLTFYHRIETDKSSKISNDYEFLDCLYAHLQTMLNECERTREKWINATN